ncbi:MAG: hypothetical protein SH868_06555 [Bythopirellula sp.]|nr:hypothetical protein [Bythopirellula sp.]
MNITYACPACEAGTRSHFDATTRHLKCNACGQELAVPDAAVQSDRVQRCLVCPSTDLFVRKDFPQRVGVLIVAVGIIGSSIAWYHADLLWTFGILFATALIDVLLYTFVGDALMCYRCQAQYRGVAEMDAHGLFDLETHERHRQLTARLESAQRATPGKQPS